MKYGSTQKPPYDLAVSAAAIWLSGAPQVQPTAMRCLIWSTGGSNRRSRTALHGQVGGSLLIIIIIMTLQLKATARATQIVVLAMSYHSQQGLVWLGSFRPHSGAEGGALPHS